MNKLSEREIIELLGQTTPTTVPAGIPKEAKEQQQNSDDPIASNWPFDTNTLGSLNGKDEVLTGKVAALEVNKCQLFLRLILIQCIWEYFRQKIVF
jgi:hypothetical protein